ncbi:MAG: hypothetical protein ACPG9N_06850, partial [Miltoncostaeaceae bacterium]
PGRNCRLWLAFGRPAGPRRTAHYTGRGHAPGNRATTARGGALDHPYDNGTGTHYLARRADHASDAHANTHGTLTVHAP